MIRHDPNELREKLAGRRVVASISGGKDSAAMSLYLTEMGIEHDRVFMDTGWEHDATYEYLRGELTRVIGPITEIRAEKQMEEMILHKGMFPSRAQRWCTQILKVRPMQRHLRALIEAGHDLVNAVGIRAGESEARSRMAEWEWSDGFDCEVWRPIIAWSEEEVIDLHRFHGLRPNPLYLQGARRVGCWPCINSRKDEIRLLADIDPERLTKLRVLEEQVTELARQRAEAKGETLPNAPGFFQAKTGGTGECWPIDKVVAWSRTEHGGRQYPLFGPEPSDEGCMRWGLCETNPEDDQ